MASTSPPPQNQIGFEHKGIGSVLAHNRLVVPLNQREYAWEPEHVSELLQDFTGAIENERGVYFLGTIVLTTGSGDVPEVSDGQQRLATTTILLATIRDYFHREKDIERALSIENEYLKITDLESTKVVPKLQLNVDDNDFFTRAIVSSPNAAERKSTKPTQPSHFRIKEAADICAKHVQTIPGLCTSRNRLDFLCAPVTLAPMPDALKKFHVHLSTGKSWDQSAR